LFCVAHFCFDVVASIIFVFGLADKNVQRSEMEVLSSADMGRT
jgi:hypothetical protein